MSRAAAAERVGDRAGHHDGLVDQQRVPIVVAVPDRHGVDPDRGAGDEHLGEHHDPGPVGGGLMQQLDRLVHAGLLIHQGVRRLHRGDLHSGHRQSSYRVAEMTSISHGPTNPSGPSNSARARPISAQAASRSGSGRPASIWCSAPKDSRSKATQSAALAIRSGDGTVSTAMSRKPACGEGGLGDARAAEAERAGLPGRRRRQLGAAADDADRDGEEPVALRGRVDDRGDAAARAQRAAHAGQRGLLVREVDQPDPGDDRIEAGLLDVEVFAVELAGGDVVQAGVAGRLRRVLQDCRGDVGGQDVPGGADPACRGQALPAGAGGYVEHAAAGGDPGGVEHPLGGGAEPIFDDRPPPVPRLGGVLPLRAGGDLVLLRIECDGHDVSRMPGECRDTRYAPERGWLPLETG